MKKKVNLLKKQNRKKSYLPRVRVRGNSDSKIFQPVQKRKVTHLAKLTPCKSVFLAKISLRAYLTPTPLLKQYIKKVDQDLLGKLSFFLHLLAF